jgi:hypothetical protein
LSSAILYLAIVAIWAGVLIPRWLRRDSSASSSGSSGSSGAEATTAEPDPAAGEQPAPRSRRREESGHAAQARAAARPEAPDARREARDAGREAPEGRRGAPPASKPQRDQERKRVLSARRRLLGMLLVLAIGSGALAVTKLAAWWVVVPPSVMLLGYMALLREASRADSARRELARTRTADAAAAAPAPAAPPAPAPDAEVIDLSASLGSVVQAGEELYDQYADAKLRAVGDLA